MNKFKSVKVDEIDILVDNLLEKKAKVYCEDKSTRKIKKNHIFSQKRNSYIKNSLRFFNKKITKRIISGFILIVLIATLPSSSFLQLYANDDFNVIVTLEPRALYNGETVYINVSVPDYYNISSFSAEITQDETIDLVLIDNSSDYDIWGGSWIVHDTEPGSHVVRIRGLDNDNFSYSASGEWEVLDIVDDSKDNSKIPPEINTNDSIEPEITDSIPQPIEPVVNETSNESDRDLGLNVSIFCEQSVYFVNENVKIDGIVSYNNSLIDTEITIDISSFEYNLSDTATVSSGKFIYEFVPSNMDIYDVRATVFYENESANRSIAFTIVDNSGDDLLNLTHLTVWDDTDYKECFVGDSVSFYSKCSCNNQSIPNSSCLISFNISGWTEPEPMIYSDGYYVYRRAFDNSGMFEFSVSCSAPGFENITLMDMFVISEIVSNDAVVSIIDPKVKENVYVVPGTSFYIERTISGLNNTEVIFAPLYTDSLILERIEIINNNSIEGEPKVKKILNTNDYRLGNGASKSEKKLDKIREKLIDKMEKLESASLSDLIILNEPIKIRVWFKAPSWDDIITNSVNLSGRISYIVFSESGDDFDFEGSTWWAANWNYRKLLTVNSSLVYGNLLNFPILVNVTDSDLASDAQNDGDDIAFVLYSDNSTKLNHQIESFNGATGKLLSWVNITNLMGAVDTKIWMYYGNSACTSQQNPTGVWNGNFVFVHHLNETSGNHQDSTSRNNDATTTSVSTQGGNIGKIDGADDFNDANTDYVTFTTTGMTTTAGTISLWGNLDASTGTRSYFFSHRTGTNNNRASFYEQSGTLYVAFSSVFSNNIGYVIPTDTWHHYALTWSGATWIMYVDGIQKGTASPGALTGIDASCYLGSYLAIQEWFDGIIDEVRVSNVARNVSWINTSYYNLKYPDTFIIFGSEEKRHPDVSSPVPVDGATNISIPPSRFNITINEPTAAKMNITWRTNASGSWVTFNTTGGASGVSNGTYSVTNTSWVTTHSKKYWWSVNVSNDVTWTNATYSFTTSYQPQLSSPSPTNGSVSIIKPICSVTVSDQDGGTVTVRFYENTTGSWVLQQTNSSVSVGSPATVVWNNYTNASALGIRYWWKVNVSDGTGCFIENIYHFNTTTDDPPVLSFETPTDQSTGNQVDLSTINVTITDTDGDTMDWSIETSPNVGDNSGDAAGNGSISCSVSGLSAGTLYYWYVNVTDGILWTKEVYSFTTSISPTISLIYPSPNGTTNINIQPTCQVWANDSDGDLLTITWATNASGSWTNVYTNTGVSANSTVGYQFTQFDNYSKIYYWKVYVNDSNTNTSLWFYFTTTPITTSVNAISPYTITSSPLSISATGDSGLDNVTLYYRWSEDNFTWHTLTYDNFEVDFGNYTDGGTACWLYTGGTYAHQGSNAADIEDNLAIDSSFYHTNTIDLATPGYLYLKVEFWFYAVSMEAGEDFWVQFNNGGGWVTVADYNSGTEFVNGQFYHKTVWINESVYNLTTTSQVRFLCDASGTGDDVYIDEIWVNATGTGWSIWSNALNPDTDYTNGGWNWTFNFPNSTGYYEFYSIGKKSGIANESMPDSADARCYYNTLGSPPTIGLINPSPNGTTDVGLQPICQIWANDTIGDTLTVYWYENTTGSWVLRNTNSSVSANSIVMYNFSQFNYYYTDYWWKVSVNDSYWNTTDIYHFITEEISTSINPISPYYQESSPLSISATGDSGLDNVTLYYRWSETLTYDNFEVDFGNYTDGGTACWLYTGGTYAHQGSNAADIEDNLAIDSSFYHTNTIDLATPGYLYLKVEFWFYAVSMEAGEDFWVQFNNGGGWVTVADYNSGTEFVNGQFYHETVWINESVYDLTTTSQVRFLCDASGTGDDVYIDEIWVNATGMGWSIWSNALNPDTDYTNGGWNWTFNFPNSTVYYEFYSIGKKSGSVDETAPTTADAICRYVITTIDIIPDEWNIGTTTIGAYNYSTSGYYFNLTNNGTIALDIQIKASNATNATTGAVWNLSASPGFDNYSLQYNKSSGTWTNINQTYSSFITSFNVGSWQTFDLNIFMATTSTKNDPLLITITFRSVVS